MSSFESSLARVRPRGPRHAWLMTAAALLCGGCASLPEGEPDPRDRFERFNRASYRFNDALDRGVLKPTAKAYSAAIPAPLRRGVGNFLGNLAYPRTILNQALQGKIKLAGRDSARFLANTILGAGFFDPASRWGLEKNEEDFGQTLGRWGVKSGPYLMLPIFGPSTVRDGAAIVPNQWAHPRQYLEDDALRYGLAALDLIDERAALLSTDEVLSKAFDPYAFLRNAWLQRREYQVRDGAEDPEAELPEDEFLDDEEVEVAPGGGAAAPAQAAAGGASPG